MSAQVAADLRAAADVLERNGWTQHTNFDEQTGCRCAMGALAFIASDGETSHDGVMRGTPRGVRLDAAAGQVVDLVSIGITVWNDADGRTAAEVIAALRSAADKAEQS